MEDTAPRGATARIIERNGVQFHDILDFDGLLVREKGCGEAKWPGRRECSRAPG